MEKIVQPLAFFTFTTDSKDGRLIEMNQGERSWVKPLNKRNYGDVFRHKIIPYLENTVFDRTVPVEYITHIGTRKLSVIDGVDQYFDMSKMDYGAKCVILPSYCPSRGLEAKVRSFKQEFKNATLSNLERAGRLLLEEKNFASDIATMAKVNAPQTRTYKIPDRTSDLPKIIADVEAHFKNMDKVVLKPSTAQTGEGIIVLPMDNIENDLKYLLRNIKNTGNQKRFDRHGWAENFWRWKWAGAKFQIQEYLEGPAVAHKGAKWLSTERFLWTYVVGKDANNNLVKNLKVHGGFRKLPRSPFENSKAVSNKNVISFSYAHNATEQLKRFFLIKARGSGEQILLNDIEVAAESKNLHIQLKSIFEKLYTMPENDFAALVDEVGFSHEDNIQDCLESRRSVAQHFTEDAPYLRVV